MFFHPVVSSFFLLSFPRLISAVGDWMSTYFHTRCGLSANLECRSEMCSTRLAEKYSTQKLAKNSPSAHHRTTLSGYIFAIKACIDKQKKNLLNSNISSACPHSAMNFGPLTSDILLASLGHPSNLANSTDFASWLRYCSDIAHRRPTKL